MKKIAVKDLKEIANKTGCTQLIAVGWDGVENITHVATYGKSLEDCDRAAQGGNYIKRMLLKWPESDCNAEPNRVKRLKKELEELKR